MAQNQVVKVKVVRLLQDIRQWDYIPGTPEPPPKPTILYLMRLRSEIADKSPAKRRLTIPIQMCGCTNWLARPIKIRQIKPSDLPPLPKVEMPLATK